ncbi:MAG: hypothetical protein K6T54_05040 [Ignavibacterium sp.]|nr:hypothetical protein [Ignavibacterium sp.]
MENSNNTKNYKSTKKNFIQMGSGVALGIALGAAIQNIALGLIVGIIIGGVGIAIDKSRKSNSAN